MSDAIIVAAKRTAVGKFNGSLATIAASDLGAVVMGDLVAQTSVPPDAVGEVIMGQVLTAGVGQNPARQAMMKANLDVTTPAMTINQVCGSGLRAVQLAAQAIKSGDAEVVIAGGQENMSLSPHVLLKSRQGLSLGHITLLDSMVHDGLTDAFTHYHMGITAENIARKYDITREQQDTFASESQNKAQKAQAAGYFKSEITSVTIPKRRGDDIIFDNDEFIRGEVTSQSLSTLRPAFDHKGTVTAGNASGINDGAAALMIVSERALSRYSLTPLATIVSTAHCGLDPAIMGMGSALASKLCLDKAKWHKDDVDVVEMNEAFAAQAIAVNNQMQWAKEKVNVNGGAIAIGHPIGASGARILVTLLHQMKRQSAKKGLAAICVGGGMGIAMAIESV